MDLEKIDSMDLEKSASTSGLHVFTSPATKNICFGGSINVDPSFSGVSGI